MGSAYALKAGVVLAAVARCVSGSDAALDHRDTERGVAGTRGIIPDETAFGP